VDINVVPVRVWTAVVALATAVAVSACGSGGGVKTQQQTSTPAAADYAALLHQRVTTDAMFGHLQRLQAIADTDDGNRAVGTSGYSASVDYVVKALHAKGFDVQTPEFEFRWFHADEPSLSVGGANVGAHFLEYSIGSPPQGVMGPLVAAQSNTLGCTASDYGSLPITGAVALVDRGSCTFSTKEQAALQRGAVALIIADNVDEDRLPGTLGEHTDVKIPVISVSKADGARLRAQPATTTIKLNAGVETLKVRNVIAQTKTGSTHNVVMVGAHLDGVKAGPGINDNGSGVAAVLETALQMGSSPPVRNAVRFGFWGAEEIGLVGSDKYIQTLDVNSLKDIALYLNFDMLASPNPGYFTYHGDQSAQHDQSGPQGPAGSDAIERTLVAYLTSAGKMAEDISFGGRSDYAGFLKAGIPAAGLFSGAEDKKTAEQARLWGGQADQPFDPNYHQKSDTLDHIDRTALGINGGGVAYVVGLYAGDVGGPNGLPSHDDRTRQLVSP
jgi:Zn-dependent M28 family amino/carboxypeptidase